MGMGEQGFDGDEKRQLQMAKLKQPEEWGVMTGGLKITGRLAIAAIFCAIGGLPGAGGQAEAADLGGDCCADLEERVAELEATTVRKGNKKVKVELYGRVNRVVNVWDDGAEQNAYVLNNSYSSTRFGMRGKAKITDDWSSGIHDRNRGRRQPFQVRRSVQRQSRQRWFEYPQVSNLHGKQEVRQSVARSTRAQRRTTSSRIPSSSKVSIRRCMPTSI